MKQLEKEIFSCSTDSNSFEQLALKVFEFQYQNIPIYRSFVDSLNITKPNSILEIPFLPISFFKSHKVIVENKSATKVFKSSGTTGDNRSEHHVVDEEMYKRSFLPTYENQIGNPKNQIIIALLPNYVSQGDSSLVYMVNELIQRTKHPKSGFYLENIKDLPKVIKDLKKVGKQIILFGVSYALLDLAELKPNLEGVTIIETGGMKGRRKELLKEELHFELKNSFEVNYISSEYGMTELLSQAYLNKDEEFITPPWMKVLVREVNDPFNFLMEGRSGGINVIDLANLYSCSFIATQDLGKLTENGFKIIGRYDNADIRGCNLLVN